MHQKSYTMIKERFIDYVADSIRNNWEKEALSDYKGLGYTYKEIAESIAKIHLLFKEAGIKEGDKISLVGKNSANWCSVYLATVTYGAVIVPILPDFKVDDLTNIINHSDSVALISDLKIWEGLDYKALKEIRHVLQLETFEYLDGRDEKAKKYYGSIDEHFKQKYPNFSQEDIKYADTDNEKLAVISYTSGTTGFSKGVMIPHRSLAANTRYAQNNMPLVPGDKIVSFLPLAHTYGCAFEFLFPFTYGCHITILTKTPSPQVIVQAFKEIRPRLILSVPLVIEKIYKKQLIPVISKTSMKILLAIPGINSILHKSIRGKLVETFGGNFHEIVIGGAAFNADAEKFFKKIKFPFTVGYGMTECGPLVSYASATTTKLGASGRPVDTLEVTIDSDDPQNEVGEILMRGDNIMLGYYKNEEATAEIIDKEGWMHSGDLGIMDTEKNIFIKGRSKSMLLGPSGNNIYPEEIESAINNETYVAESVVISENDKLVALIYPDSDHMKKDDVTEDQLEGIYEDTRKIVNGRLPSYMQVTKFKIHKEEFVKTPKRSIKRFLYT